MILQACFRAPLTSCDALAVQCSIRGEEDEPAISFGHSDSPSARKEQQISQNEVPTQAGAVVVGVDGSSGAGEALRWALAEARLRKVPLRVVHAWRYGYEGAPGVGTIERAISEVGQLRQGAEEVLERAISEVVGETADVEIERQVVEGGAAAVLVGAAAEGDLLVVGSRGHGGFAGLLLGSVSQQCVHHSRCPVVVVRSSEARPRDHESDHDAGSQPVPESTKVAVAVARAGDELLTE